MTTPSALFAGLDARTLGAPRAGELQPLTGVTVDSRKAGPGVIFVAARGATQTSKDGHDFIGNAIRAGAALILVEDESKGLPFAADAPVMVVRDARRAAAILAERLAGNPSTRLKLVGITGTNGKTTTTWLIAQLAEAAGMKAAVLGTLGVGPVSGPKSLGYTTPEAEVISHELKRLADDGVQLVAMEVSSHALATRRADGLTFAALGFTNLTRDHLDFHGSMEAYFEAKARLFGDVAPTVPAVIPASVDEDGWHARLRALRPDALTWGMEAGAGIVARGVTVESGGMRGELAVGASASSPWQSPLLGAYNVENLLVAAGSMHHLGVDTASIIRGIAGATAPPGRLQRVSRDGEPLVVVDYAHTPDALERALHVMRGVTAGKLTVVFGCGGDRDPGKRPLMGRIAAEIADIVVVTDDNPRSEDPAAITDAIVAGVGLRKRLAQESAAELEVGELIVERHRARAIRLALQSAVEGDAILVAGKGHEQGQTAHGVTRPFDDVREVRRAFAAEAAPPVLPAELVVAALRGRGVEVIGALPKVLAGVGTDSRKVEPQSLFVALAGERFDAHDFVAAVLGAGGAGAALVSHAKKGAVGGATPLLAVDDTLLALQDLARAWLRTLSARRVALTGSNGKTTTKELIAAALGAALGPLFVQATHGNLNNHIGVPLTALAADPTSKALVFEMGMNHLEEIALLADIVRPEVGLITNIGTAHAGNVGGIEGVARAKAELFEALPKDGVAVVNADDPRCVREAQAKAKCRHIAFGRAPWSDVKLTSVRDRDSGGQEIELTHAGRSVETFIPLEGRHNASNAAGAVACAVALGLPFEVCARGLAHTHAAHGRLERRILAGDVWLLDDTYNANPDSMEAALAALTDIGGARRKIVVLGEMRELGEFAEQEHRHIGAAAQQAGAAALFSCGALGRLYGEAALKAGLPPSAFIWAADNSALAERVVTAVKDGDVVLIKGSRGARMEVVVDALKRARARI